MAIEANYLLWIPLLPLIGAAINGIIGHKLPKAAVRWIACSMIFVSALLSLAALWAVWKDHPDKTLQDKVFTWLWSGDLGVQMRFVVDRLTAVMLNIVCWVGFLIHVYSIGYMAHDRSQSRFFAFLNLFAFSMLILVLADSLVLMFVGWEGVGLCSYLLIGFWYEDNFKATCGRKAFVVNRIGDFGFLLGMFLLFIYLRPGNELINPHTGPFIFSFSHIQANVGSLPPEIIGAVCALFFVGAMGKSAQLPLYVWLPDAMAGPTPVSALIHAATMVTAGVYMIARMHFLYAASQFAMILVAAVGAATAIFAATIAINQTDIKKVLAYSTVSQLGYMFIGVGLGAFSAGVFHLMTHAFFKACLFLGAGAVIHAMSDNNDIRKMGGLWKKMPLTAWAFLFATLAIMGMFPFSGFFSKDAILLAAYSSHLPGAKVIWIVGMVAAVLTSFYMWRLFFVVFTGKLRAEPDIAKKVHEQPPSMTIPVTILGVLSIIGGLLAMPHLFGGHDYFDAFLHPIFKNQPMHGSALPLILAVLCGLAGFAAAFFMYFRSRSTLPQKLAEGPLKWLYKPLINKWYVDEIYDFLIVRPLKFTAYWLYRLVDYWFIDRFLIDTVFARGPMLGGKVLRLLQNGNVATYAVVIMVALAVTLFFVVRW